MTDTLTLTINDQAITGWTYADITAGIERMPRMFHLGIIYSADLALAKADRISPAGQHCVLKYGNTILVTGYIDSVRSRVSEGEHEVVYVGRGACEDVVDTSFEFFAGYDPEHKNIMLGVPVSEAVRRVLATSGVKLVVENHIADSIINQATGNIGDTNYSAIELFNRQTGCLLYENADGAFVLGSPGSAPPSKTLITHQLCVSSQVNVDLSNVHSDYWIYSNSDAHNKDISFTPGNSHNPVFDNRKQIGGGKRTRIYRQIVAGYPSTAVYTGDFVSYQQLYSNWYSNRQMGRAQIIEVQVIGWADQQGVIWQPNSMVSVYLPNQNIQVNNQPIQYLIAECEYSLSPHHGTTTRLSLMPPYAYSTTVVNQQLDQDIAAAPGTKN